MTPSAIADQLRALGVMTGAVVQVHTSFRAVRPVDGGPAGLIEALLMTVGPDGTVVMPSWTGDDDHVFDPATTPADFDLGVVAQTLWRRPDARRGAHPFAWAAVGPRAKEIVDVPMTLPPHGPESAVGRVHDLGGQVLLLGVGHDADTSLHLAELKAGVPYRIPHHITVLEDGVPTRIDYGENDSCCARFALADDWLRAEGLQHEGTVGRATARLFRSRDVVRLACAALKDDPLLFLHATDEGCAECDTARASVRVI